MLREANILSEIFHWTELSKSDQEKFISLKPDSAEFQNLHPFIQQIIYTAIWMKEWSTPPSQRGSQKV